MGWRINIRADGGRENNRFTSREREREDFLNIVDRDELKSNCIIARERVSIWMWVDRV
jgi:hypothetical protein